MPLCPEIMMGKEETDNRGGTSETQGTGLNRCTTTAHPPGPGPVLLQLGLHHQPDRRRPAERAVRVQGRLRVGPDGADGPDAAPPRGGQD